DIPPHVEVIHAHGRRVMDLFHQCRFVVIPMAYNNRPGGESVMLEAMAYGKPIVVTRTVTTVDFVMDGKNGTLFELGDREGLKKAVLHYWNDGEACRRIGRNNVRRYHELFSTEASARNAGKAIRILLGQAGIRPQRGCV
ncbi:glycosyltransferase, partial [bacterium]|nr:glycosyltransferase [bacterium]